MAWYKTVMNNMYIKCTIVYRNNNIPEVLIKADANKADAEAAVH